MARFDPMGTAARLARSLKAADLTAKAKTAAGTLKAEYAAGQRGDDAPAKPIWGSPKEQLDSLIGLLRAAKATPIAEEHDEQAEAREVTMALQSVDWADVRAATAERTSDAARVMRTMADQVDWAKVQPVAAQVSSALIAAVASGHLGVGGRLGATVARAIVDQGGLGQRVASQLHDQAAPLPPDFRRAIDVTARET
jgi:hypothetical protein